MSENDLLGFIAVHQASNVFKQMKVITLYLNLMFLNACHYFLSILQDDLVCDKLKALTELCLTHKVVKC